MNDFAMRVMCARGGETHLFYVGQAGFVLKSGNGQLLGVDLYLSECGERIEGHVGFKRLLPRLLQASELIFDYIIATHAHYDHFDFDSVPELMANGRTHLYASANCADEIARLNMKKERVTYVKAGDSCRMGDFTVEFVFCDHGAAAPDAVGVIVNVDGKRIYMAGDTCLRLDKADEHTKQGPIDIMIAPINGAFGNLDEQDCAELSRAVMPKLTIPCHYGMFASHGGNVGAFMDAMKRVCPDNEYFIMTQGEGIVI